MEYIILIVVLAVLILAVGGTMLLRPRGTRGVRRGRAGGDLGSGTGNGDDHQARHRHGYGRHRDRRGAAGPAGPAARGTAGAACP